jgi:hypothetical protein
LRGRWRRSCSSAAPTATIGPLRGGEAVRALRWIVIVLATAVVAGIAGGVGARLAMRVVALTDSDPGTTFTPGGTFGIVLVAVVLGAVVVAIYSLTQRYIRGSHTRKGLVLASVLVVFPGLLFVAREALSIGRWWLNVPLFLGVDLLYALVISFTYAWLDRALPRPGRSEEPAMA